ncbi:LysE family translocator [Kiloniella sp. b19]|uniref:LysE family translocator n=1 Tax=Kiloniella sp. GXU_MW_B19 TaxID=3141326 RepID=UPI0031D36574
MIAWETVVAFFAAAVLLALTPGPDNIFVLTQSALKGRAAGIRVTLGLSTGLIVHTLAVALGVAAIFQTSALAFSLLKYLGAAYLLYLAYGAFRASFERMQQTAEPDETLPESRGNLYLRGIVMNVTNPKVSIFFLAFLPQFVDVNSGAIPLQIAQLGGLFMLATLLVFGGLALLAGSVGERVVSSQRGQRVMNRIAACVFAGLALKLATAER